MSLTAHSAYFHHSFAGNQTSADSALYDISGNIADGLPGADLAAMWDVVDDTLFAVTADPDTGVTDSVIRLPNLNPDYNGGEKIIGWWLGHVTAEVAAAEMMGDGTATSGPGIAVRINTNGTHQLVLSDGTTTTFSGSASVAVADGELRSLAFAINGEDKTYCLWTDDVPFSNVATYQSLASGVERDTRNANTWNIGCARPKSAASTAGIVTQTRALVMCRLGADDEMPSVARLTQIFKALRRAPGHLIRSDAF